MSPPTMPHADPSTTGHDPALHDLGPLAWVLDELRKSLVQSDKALKRFVRESEAAGSSELTELDTTPLRLARQQLHQAVGALDMVGQSVPAQMLRAMESATQKFIQQPDLCSDTAAACLEQAGFALVEYLERVLAGKPLSPVALFPQYREVQRIAGADRIHPADLFVHDWHWTETALPNTAPQATGSAASRSEQRPALDQAVLKIVRSADPQAASALCTLALGFAAELPQQAEQRPVRVFWQIVAACAEAIASGALAMDVYAKRAISRILLQYSSLAKGDTQVSDRLVQDLLFFCAQALPSADGHTPVLQAVRQAHGLTHNQPVQYEEALLGRFDPALLAQTRKRIGTAKEAWSSLTGGDASKFRTVAEQFGLVAESLVKFHPQSASLAQTLTQVMDNTVRSGITPSPELALEVATSVLYLEAGFEDLDPADPLLAERTTHLAERLQQVLAGGPPQALSPWMEELYRRVSDRQTMGSVVGELRVTMNELERELDLFFRNPREKGILSKVPGQMAQMRGVFSVLGLDTASRTVQHMRDAVDGLLTTDADPARLHATYDQLGNNLGALGFLIDMLNHQPTLAKKLFVFDEASGELRATMGRHGAPDTAAGSNPDTLASAALAAATAGDSSGTVLSEQLSSIATQASLADQPGLAAAARSAVQALSVQPPGTPDSAAIDQFTALVAPMVTQMVTPLASAPGESTSVADTVYVEDDLLAIFLDEAREVVGNGLQAVQALQTAPDEPGQLIALRRSFHTLKGSARMVGLQTFGNAAWSLEQLMNAWLADHKPATPELLGVVGESLQAFGRWVDDIGQGQHAHWRADDFSARADALREPGSRLPDAALTLAHAPEPDATTLTVSDADSQALSPANPLTLDGPPADWLTLDLELTPAPSDSPQEAPAQVANLPLLDIDLAELDPNATGDSPAIDPSTITVPSELTASLVPEATPLPDVDFDALFGDLDLTLPPANPQAPAPEINDIDLASLASMGQTPAVSMDGDAASSHSPDFPDTDSNAQDTANDDQTRSIDGLRIHIPLYNVYLNEADEWSRRLLNELSEWALELHQPMPDSTVGLAHSLAGSSATVGFTSLSALARTLEHVLQQTQLMARGTPERAQTLVAAAEDIRRLLHQFAAGFLKEPNPAIYQTLKELEAQAITPPGSGPAAAAAASVDWAEAETVEPPAADIPAPALPDPAVSSPDHEKNTAPALLNPDDSAINNRANLAPESALPPSRDADDELDETDVVDVDLFPIFEEEAIELLPQLGAALRQWTARPDNTSARTEVLRVLHTLKGSARLAGAMRLGELAHLFESQIESLGPQQADADLTPLLARFDALQLNFDALRTLDAARYQALSASQMPQPEVLALPQASLPVDSSPAGTTQPTAAATSDNTTPRPAATQTVRVRAGLLERLLNQAGEVMLTRTRLEAELGQLRSSLKDLTGNLDRLRQHLREVELQAESQMQSRLAQAQASQQNFDPLEFDRFTRVQELTRMMAESVNDVATVQRNLQRTVQVTEDDLTAQARQTRELQRDLLRTRMLEFEGISERLYRVVRQTSKETGKQVRLDIEGGRIEMDRAVLDRMTPAFEHLLRNSVVHGIETPEARQRTGKPDSGVITVRLLQDGNDVSVEFEDDGAGLNLPAIRQQAEAQGLISPGQWLDDATLANLIFTPGFSTASEVTELAGRGIGMDVVRSEVNALGGRIETRSQPGLGSAFKLVLPLTTAVTQVVMLRMGTLAVGVSASVVELVRRTSAQELEQAYQSGVLDFAGEPVPFFWGGALLQGSQRSTEVLAKNIPVVVFRSAGQRVALHVDEVLGHQEVVVKNLGSQLARLPGLSGVTVLASGAVALIYNPVALTTVYGAQARQWMASSHADAAGALADPVGSPVPLVLVVDDSITVRRVTQRLLQREGYRVALAADGLQALEQLQIERPVVVLSDIEMPRMDGFDLVRNIRADAALASLPVVMITSRIAEKHREHARALGVDHYLGKPYSEDELLGLIRLYSQVEV